jgi:hypothetical protein
MNNYKIEGHIVKHDIVENYNCSTNDIWYDVYIVKIVIYEVEEVILSQMDHGYVRS